MTNSGCYDGTSQNPPRRVSRTAAATSTTTTTSSRRHRPAPSLLLLAIGSVLAVIEPCGSLLPSVGGLSIPSPSPPSFYSRRAQSSTVTGRSSGCGRGSGRTGVAAETRDVAAEGDHPNRTPDRRSVLARILTASSIAALVPNPSEAYDTPATTAAAYDTPAVTPAPTAPPLAPITHVVTFSVRISRSDGTFYVRDDPPGTVPDSNNQVFRGELALGLYGSLAPVHTARFLQFAGNAGYGPAAVVGGGSGGGGEGGDDTLPSYARSTFPSIDPANGLVQAGAIPGLALTTVIGSPALQYRGRILPAPLWIETGRSGASGGSAPIKHGALPEGGLLSHRNLDASPCFGITTGNGGGYDDLDRSHTVFGQVLVADSPDSRVFLERVAGLPTYLNDRPAPSQNSGDGPIVGGDGGDNSVAKVVVEEAASAVFSLQKNFFRGAAKSFGDTRLDNVYAGKILRRVEVTDVSVRTL